MEGGAGRGTARLFSSSVVTSRPRSATNPSLRARAPEDHHLVCLRGRRRATISDLSRAGHRLRCRGDAPCDGTEIDTGVRAGGASFPKRRARGTRGPGSAAADRGRCRPRLSGHGRIRGRRSTTRGHACRARIDDELGHQPRCARPEQPLAQRRRPDTPSRRRSPNPRSTRSRLSTSTIVVISSRATTSHVPWTVVIVSTLRKQLSRPRPFLGHRRRRTPPTARQAPT